MNIKRYIGISEVNTYTELENMYKNNFNMFISETLTIYMNTAAKDKKFDPSTWETFYLKMLIEMKNAFEQIGRDGINNMLHEVSSKTIKNG